MVLVALLLSSRAGREGVERQRQPADESQGSLRRAGGHFQRNFVNAFEQIPPQFDLARIGF